MIQELEQFTTADTLRQLKHFSLFDRAFPLMVLDRGMRAVESEGCIVFVVYVCESTTLHIYARIEKYAALSKDKTITDTKDNFDWFILH